MRDLHRLFHSCLMLSGFIGRRDPEAELTAPTPEEFRVAIMRGELRGTPSRSWGGLEAYHVAEVLGGDGGGRA
jgi:hypothetical protein